MYIWFEFVIVLWQVNQICWKLVNFLPHTPPRSSYQYCIRCAICLLKSNEKVWWEEKRLHRICIHKRWRRNEWMNKRISELLQIKCICISTYKYDIYIHHIFIWLSVCVFVFESTGNSTCKNTQKPFLYVCMFASVIRKKGQKKQQQHNFPFARMSPHTCTHVYIVQTERKKGGKKKMELGNRMELEEEEKKILAQTHRNTENAAKVMRKEVETYRRGEEEIDLCACVCRRKSTYLCKLSQYMYLLPSIRYPHSTLYHSLLFHLFSSKDLSFFLRNHIYRHSNPFSI